MEKIAAVVLAVLVFVGIGFGWANHQDKVATASGRNMARPPSAPSPSATAEPSILSDLPIDPKVLVVGDSLAAGWDVSVERRAWPAVLDHSLVARPELTIVAQPGGTVEQVAGLGRPSGADLIIVELGTNNAGQGLPLRRYRSEMRELLREVAAENAGAPILLLGPWIQDSLAEPYDEAGEELCAEVGCTFEAISDAYTETGPIPAGREVLRGVSDGFHAGDEGHALIAEQVLAALS